MSGWQPIETAPKDGTQFLGWRGYCAVWFWQGPEGKRPVGWRDFMWVYREGDGPTHWMPLPAAPDSQP